MYGEFQVVQPVFHGWGNRCREERCSYLCGNLLEMEAEHKSLSVNPPFIPLKLHFPNRLKASRDTH